MRNTLKAEIRSNTKHKEDKNMTVQYHSMRNNVLVTVTLTDEEVAHFRNYWEELPFHNGFADFEDFVICCLSYND